MRCRRRNGMGFDMSGPMGMWHRLWCPECRAGQEADAMIGFGLTQLRDEPASPYGIAETLALLDLQTGGRSVRRAARHVALHKLFLFGRTSATLLLFPVAWFLFLSYLPPMTIPKQVYPAQNGFNSIQEAATHLEYADEITNAVQPPRPGSKPTPRINKVKKYTYGTKREVRQIFDSEHLYTLADKRLLVDSNREALAKLRAALPCEYTTVYPRSFATSLDFYTDYRTFARLLRVEAQVKEAKGDWYGAAESDLDAMEFGIKTAHGAPLIGGLVSIANLSLGENGLYKEIEHLNAAQTKAVLARLIAIEAQRTPLADTLREDEWLSLEEARTMMRDPRWRFNSAGTLGAPLNESFSGLPFLYWPNYVMLNNLKGYQDTAVQRALLPYPALKRATPIQEPKDPLSKLMYPVFTPATFKYFYWVETQLALLRTTLALHAYAKDHQGRYPQQLAQLTPTYLPEVPKDPFNGPITLRDRSELSPLSYRCFQTPTGHTPLPDYLKEIPADMPGYCGRNDYVLYSVGQDGKDDQGAPIDRNQNDKEHVVKGAARYQNPTENYTGDIVAGVNR